MEMPTLQYPEKCKSGPRGGLGLVPPVQTLWSLPPVELSSAASQEPWARGLACWAPWSVGLVLPPGILPPRAGVGPSPFPSYLHQWGMRGRRSPPAPIVSIFPWLFSQVSGWQLGLQEHLFSQNPDRKSFHVTS